MYRVILTINNRYKKTLHRSKTKEASFDNFRRLIDENNNVIFPKQYTNSHGINKIKYKILVVKDKEDFDENRTLRDGLGKLYIEKPIFDLWTVLSDSDYEIEETFWMYGRDPVFDRVTIHEILKPMMLHAYKKTTVKQLIVVNNKLVLYNEDQFEMVICKCKKDAQRLHHALAKACSKNKIKSIIFMGTASKATIPQMYSIILENTDWSIEKIRRTSTRP
jgi:hypothetical protein